MLVVQTWTGDTEEQEGDVADLKELNEGRSLQSSRGKYGDVKHFLWCQGVI